MLRSRAKEAVITESGVVDVFRKFTGLQLGLLLVTALGILSSSDHAPHPLSAVGSMSLATAVLFACLVIPQLERRLGRAYLPLAVVVASAIPLTGEGLSLGVSFDTYARLATEASAFLLVPLLVVSWEYGFRTVSLFSVGTALLDFGLVGMGYEAETWIPSDYTRVVALRTVGFLAVGYIVSLLAYQQRRQWHELAKVNAELTRYSSTQEQLAVSRERNRLARELHDTLAHTLSSVAVQLEAARTLWDRETKEARTMVERSLGSARSGLRETRRALKALRAEPLDDLGLVLAIRSLAESFETRCGWALDLSLPEHWAEVPKDVGQCFYRVTQEALSNVAKHADARRVSVSLSQDEDATVLSISDDGRGFDLRLDDFDDGSGHFGLRGIRERAELIGGDLRWDSAVGRGTTLTLGYHARTPHTSAD